MSKYDQKWDDWDHEMVPVYEVQDALRLAGYAYDPATRIHQKVDGKGDGISIVLTDERRNRWAWHRLRGGRRDKVHEEQRGDRIREVIPLGFPYGKSAHWRHSPPPGFEILDTSHTHSWAGGWDVSPDERSSGYIAAGSREVIERWWLPVWPEGVDPSSVPAEVAAARPRFQVPEFGDLPHVNGEAIHEAVRAWRALVRSTLA